MTGVSPPSRHVREAQPAGVRLAYAALPAPREGAKRQKRGGDERGLVVNEMNYYYRDELLLPL